MKDFSINEEEQEKFITNYKVYRDAKNQKFLLFKTANHEQYLHGYSKEIENKVLDKMKSQTTTEELESKLEIFQDKYDSSINKTSVMITANIAVIITIIALFANPVTLSMTALLTIINLFGCSEFLLKPNKEKINDIKKILYFNENEKFLNDDIRKKSIVANVNEKTADKIINGNNNEMIFNINTIDDMSLEDLQELKDSIEKSKSAKQKVYKLNK
ncbi:MAG TPA: hypothetical protein PLV83_04795 [Bacilli bacterium]|nr:hypothetical protein [Bacilli bacterium]